MGRKKHQAPGLGKSLIKDRFGKNSSAHLHAAELAAEHVDEDLNLKSVTELNSLDEFLATAELAGTEFTAKRLNVHFVNLDEKGMCFSKYFFGKYCSTFVYNYPMSIESIHCCLCFR